VLYKRLLICAGLAAACSAPAPPPDLARAERLEHGGHDDLALAAYDAAAAACVRERHAGRRARWCSAARWGRAATLERMGRAAGAAAAYAELYGDPDVLPATQAAGLAAAGRLELGLGRDARGYDLLWQAIASFPEDTAADDALRLVLRDGRRRDPRQLYGVLGDLYVRLQATAVADNLIFAMATLAREDLGDPGEARRLYDVVADAHPKSPLFDDALWEAARLAEAARDWPAALDHYRRILATRERSLFIGSYHSRYLDDAQVAAGRLLRDALGDPRGAARELEKVERDYPTSTLRDNTL